MTIVDFFDNCRFWGGKRNKVLQGIRFYGIVNTLVAGIANIVLPIYFRLTSSNPKNRLSTTKREGQKVIVSLTSFPVRLPKLWLVIETLLRQTVKPDRIILYLTKSQIGEIETLPKPLLKQRRRGLEIRLCPDEIRSHTKYFYAFQEFPNDYVVTVDDDLFYRSDLIERHLKNAANNPQCVIANWVKEIIPGKYKYTEWPDLADIPKLSKNLLILGVSSVMYPPKALHNDAYNVDNIKKLTLTADDVWITAMLLKNGTTVYYTAEKLNHLPVSIKNNETLISGNYVRNQQCVDAINSYYEARGEERPFIDIPLKNIQ